MKAVAADEVPIKLKTIFTDILSHEIVPVEQRTKLNCMQWDSLNHLKLVVAMEQEFKITFSDEDIIDLNSFEMAMELVTSKIA
jgi:acyl carrier protein